MFCIVGVLTPCCRDDDDDDDDGDHHLYLQSMKSRHFPM